MNPEAGRASDGGRALGAGLAFGVVALTYQASGFGADSHWWAAVIAIVIGPLLADAVTLMRAHLPDPGLGAVPALGVLAAIAACVPETDQLLVAATPVALLIGAELVLRRQLGLEWYAVAAVAIGWGGLFGASGRPSALVGALFAWWVLLLPLAISRVTVLPAGGATLSVAGFGTVAALVMARTGGLVDSGWAAIVASVVGCAVVSAAVAWLVVKRFNARPTNPPT